MLGIWSWKLCNPHENRSQIISAFEQNGLRIKRFWKPEQCDVSEAMLKWFQQDRSDNVPVSGPLLMITFALSKF